jgi:hypothetical protein
MSDIEITSDTVVPATTRIADVSALHVRFADLHKRMVDASKPGAQITREELQTITREMGQVQHELQSTSATGPKRAAAPKKEKAAKVPSAGIDTSMLDDLD